MEKFHLLFLRALSLTYESGKGMDNVRLRHRYDFCPAVVRYYDYDTEPCMQ